VPSPRRIGNFDIIRLLATGGMGEVFLARQVGPAGFARAVVVKRLLPHLARDAQFVEMFLNEGRLTGMLTHPNIAQVYELGEDGGSYFLAMEFVHGRSLRQLERALADQGRLIGPALAARISIDALRGLHAAHTLRVDGRLASVVHRDMSPDNILVGFNGVARVIDFGVARAKDAASTTRTGHVKGKFAYMAPERFAGDKADPDPRIDVYAMAVVLYEALCGQRPHTATSDAALVGAILNETPPEARQVNPLLDPALSDVIMRGLERSPEARWPSAEAFAHALEGWLAAAGQPAAHTAVAAFMRSLFGEAEADGNPSLNVKSLVAEPATTTSAVERASNRSRYAVAGGMALLSLVGAGVGYLVLAPRTADAPPQVVVVPRAEPPAAPPPSNKTGRVAFRVKPWGEIWQGEKKLGVTPNVTLTQPAGRQTFTIKNPQFPPRDIVIEVLPDTEVSVKVDLTAK